MNRTYDLCFSLGGNCSAAHNLKIRRLRPFSLPLDWTYMIDDHPLEWLCSAISNHMTGFAERKNLVEITPGHPEYNGFHRGFRKYIDTNTGFRFINHFPESLPENEAYEVGINKIRRRIERLYASFQHYNRFCMILAVRFPIRDNLLLNLKTTLEKSYPGKIFDVEFVEFNAREAEDRELWPGINVHRLVRDWNTYDTEGKNFEWRFLDDIKSTIKPKQKRKISFHIWPRVKCVVQLHRT